MYRKRTKPVYAIRLPASLVQATIRYARVIADDPADEYTGYGGDVILRDENGHVRILSGEVFDREYEAFGG